MPTNDNPRPYSRLRTVNRPRLADRLPLDAPMGLYIDPTSHCNFRCSFCPRSLPDYHQIAGKPVHFDFSLYEKLIDELSDWTKLKVLRLYFMGEPFLNSQLPEMIDLAMRRKVADRIEITSNGTVLNEKNTRQICKIAAVYETPLYLRFSIYSVFPERHQQLTASGFETTKILENIANLKRIRDETNCRNVVLYAKMIEMYSDEKELFFERYRPVVDEVAFETPMNWSGFDDNDLLRNTCEKSEIPSPSIKRRACPFPFFSMAVHADGAVVACCVDWSRHTLLGNVRNQSLREIWNSKRLLDFQVQHLSGRRNENLACQHCEILYTLPESDDVDAIDVEKWIAGST